MFIEFIVGAGFFLMFIALNVSIGAVMEETIFGYCEDGIEFLLAIAIGYFILMIIGFGGWGLIHLGRFLLAHVSIQ